MQTVMYMKEIGKMIRQMGKEYWYNSMEVNTKVGSKMIHNQDMVLNVGETVQNTKANTSTV